MDLFYELCVVCKVLPDFLHWQVDQHSCDFRRSVLSNEFLNVGVDDFTDLGLVVLIFSTDAWSDLGCFVKVGHNELVHLLMLLLLLLLLNWHLLNVLRRNLLWVHGHLALHAWSRYGHLSAHHLLGSWHLSCALWFGELWLLHIEWPSLSWHASHSELAASVVLLGEDHELLEELEHLGLVEDRFNVGLWHLRLQKVLVVNLI